MEQSVLNTVLVARPMEGITETDPSERSALAMHLDYGHLNLESPAQPMLGITRDGITDTDTDPSERLALASHLDYGLFNLELPALPMVDVALDHHPMQLEVITVPLPVESSGLVMALGNGLTEDLSGSIPLEHSVSDMEVGNGGWIYMMNRCSVQTADGHIWNLWTPCGKRP